MYYPVDIQIMKSQKLIFKFHFLFKFHLHAQFKSFDASIK